MSREITEDDLLKLTKQNGILEELGRLMVWAAKQSPGIRTVVMDYADSRVKQEIEK